MKDYVYQWDNVILGYNLQSLIYAFNTGYPVIGLCTSMPKIYESMPEIQYRDFNWGSGGTASQIELWHHLYMVLSLGGQVPFADNVGTIRIRDTDNVLVVTTQNRSRVTRVKYHRAWVFDDRCVTGLPPIVVPCETHRVFDWFNIRQGMKQKENMILTPSEDFVREIYLYPSERIDGNHPEKKDMCAVSYLHEDQIEDFKHSSTMARFKALDIMKHHGMRGTRNGIGPNGKPKHYALKIELDKREVQREAMHIYEASNESLILNYPTVRVALEESINKLTPNPYIPKVLLSHD